jgi:hypothetical protein
MAKRSKSVRLRSRVHETSREPRCPCSTIDCLVESRPNASSETYSPILEAYLFDNSTEWNMLAIGGVVPPMSKNTRASERFLKLSIEEHVGLESILPWDRVAGFRVIS